MADNNQQLKATIDDKITNAGGEESIFASDHNEILTSVLNQVGKYVGFFYEASLNPLELPAGTFSFNENPLNESGVDTIMRVAKISNDSNDIGDILRSSTGNTVLQMKDFAGRNAYFTLKGYVEKTDGTGNIYYDITVRAFDTNPNYTYQAQEKQLLCINFVANTNNIVPYGDMKIYKNEANEDQTRIESGDTVTGQLNDGIFLTRGVYVSGDLMSITSYSGDAEYFDPNN